MKQVAVDDNVGENHQRNALSSWSDVASDLHRDGVSVVPLSAEQADVIADAFGVARQVLDSVNRADESTCAAANVPWIPVTANSAHATGYHSAGGENSLSRYNQFRQGFVFSDGELFKVGGVQNFQM